MDTEFFYPTGVEGVYRAAAVCATCPIKLQCRADAAERDEAWGVWGGKYFGGLHSRPRNLSRKRAS